ncbi:hypothetical protein YC2023_060357 [Brassica napus]
MSLLNNQFLTLVEKLKCSRFPKETTALEINSAEVTTGHDRQMVRLKATKMNLFLIHKKVKQRSTPNQQHRSTPLRLQSNSKQ